jgi:hypothetical protein
MGCVQNNPFITETCILNTACILNTLARSGVEMVSRRLSMTKYVNHHIYIRQHEHQASAALES